MLEKLPVLWAAMPSISVLTAAVAAGTIIVIQLVKKLRPQWPALLIAITAAALVAWTFSLPIATIGTKFGGIPHSLPLPSLPALTIENMQAVLPNAIAFTLLGAIESLLSAVVADSMSGRRHRSNCELVAQGIANVGSSLFGGICVTGTIARTATNVRAGAHGPIAGMLHAIFVLMFMLVAAPLASFIPLAALAGILAVVSWDMIEKQAIINLLRAARGEAAVLLVTFLLTVFRDLTEAIIVGFALGSVLFIHRMSKATAVESASGFMPEDAPDDSREDRIPYDQANANDPDISVYKINGVFFFGAAASIGTIFDAIADTHKALVIDFASVPFADSSAANTIEGLARKAQRRGVHIYLAGTNHAIREEFFAHGLKPPHVHYETGVEHAISKARHIISQ